MKESFLYYYFREFFMQIKPEYSIASSKLTSQNDEVKAQLSLAEDTRISSIGQKVLQHEEDWDSDFPNFREKIVHICPPELQTSESEPFYNTDLIIFRDDFKGLMPLNGIKKREYEQIKQIYDDILNGRTFFKFDLDDMTKKSFAADLKTLLTRQKGRDIILALINNKNFKILNVTTARSEYIFDSRELWGVGSVGKDSVTLHVNYAEDRTTKLIHVIDPKTGQKIAGQIPFFISLGHELNHILHGQLEGMNTIQGIKTELPPTISMVSHIRGYDPDLSNIEEQETITGFKNIPKVKEIEDWLQEYTILNYQPLNENALRAYFRMLPRADHKRATPKIAVENPPLLKPDQLVPGSKDFEEYFALVIAKGTSEQLREMLSFEFDVNHPLDISRSNNQSPSPPPIVLAIESGDLDKIKLLVNRGASLNIVDPEGKNLCHMAASFDHSLLIPWLIENGVNINDRDPKGNTPLHYLKKARNLQELALLGADLTLKNNEGQTFLDFAFENNYHSFLQAIPLMSEELKIHYIDLYLKNDMFKNKSSHDIFNFLIFNIIDTKQNSYLIDLTILLNKYSMQNKLDFMNFVLNVFRLIDPPDWNVKDEQCTPLLHRIILSSGSFKEKIEIITTFFKLLKKVYPQKPIDRFAVDAKGNTLLHSIFTHIDEDEFINEGIMGIISWLLPTMRLSQSMKRISLILNEKNSDGKTSIQIAEELGKNKVLNYLKEEELISE